MDLSLENLFSTIIRTEREAEQEKKLCDEVKTNIETRQARLNDLKKTAVEQHQKIEHLEYCVSKSSTGLSIVKFIEEFLENKLKEIQREIKDNFEKLDTVENEKILKFANWASDVLENSSPGNEIRKSGAYPAAADTQSLIPASPEDALIAEERILIRELQLQKETLLNEPVVSSEFLELRNKLADNNSSQE
ncbi:hypothetical protein Btru_027813 [Bulinus truncatus]|nr:hypothetical protein Btru_027813 [Bulinus truncatus]